MAKKAIEIIGLSYAYPDGTKALSDINLDIYAGESVGIIGPNGAGKSTLLLHLNGILKGTGVIRVLDFKVNGKNLSQIRKKVGIVLQDPENQLFMPTVFDDVSFGPINMMMSREEVQASVEQALAEVDMLEAMGRSSHHLSFGEKKRVSIATVLSMETEILVLDEPTSNLDPRGRREIIKFLKNTDKTKIIASHDLQMISELCTRYVLLDKGKIIKSDSSLESLKNLFLD